MPRPRLPDFKMLTNQLELYAQLKSDQAKKESSRKLAELMAVAQWQALDRKVRQLQIDLPAWEHVRHVRQGAQGASGLIASKIARMEAILNELQTDE